MLSLQPHELLNLYYNRAPSYKPVQSNFVWQKRGPGSEFLGKRVPGSEFLGKRVPGSEFLGKRVPGSEFLGKRVPGSEFLGKRSRHEEEIPDSEVEELFEFLRHHQQSKRSMEVPISVEQRNDRNRFEST